MAVQQVFIQPHDETIVRCYGEPEDVRHVKGDPAIMIAGYDVMHIADAAHDGYPAKRFTLGVDNREIGRLIVRTAIATEYTFEWELEFQSPDDAHDFVAAVKNPPAEPVARARFQLLKRPDNVGLTAELARISAAFGVSAQLTGDFSRVSVPQLIADVEVTGLRDNVLRFLMSDEDGGQGLEEHDALMKLEEITA